jgi:hypothetical protein
MRVAASGRVTVQTSLAANTSLISPIVYGSESSGGNLTLRSTSDATEGDVIIGDRDTEQVIIGPTGSVSAYNFSAMVLTTNANSLANALVVSENSSNLTTTIGAAGPQSFIFAPKDPGRTHTMVTKVSGADIGQWYVVRATDGSLLGYMNYGTGWGIGNFNTANIAFRVSGTTGQTADLQQWHDTNSFGGTVSSVGANGHFRGPAGSVGVPGFAFQGDTNNGWWAPAADTQAWSLAGAEAMRLSSAGLLLKTALVIEDPGAGTNTVTINTGVVSSSYTMTLPLAQGAAGTTLVNNGSGVLSWTNPNPHKASAVTLSNGDTSKAITFTTAWGDANYTPWVSLRNTTDGSPIALAYRVIAKSTTGFTVEWDDAISGSNYSLDWGAIDHYDP